MSPEQLNSQLAETSAAFAAMLAQLDYAQLLAQYESKRQATEQPDFWDTPSQAQLHMQQLSKLEARVGPWRRLEDKLHELQELAELNDTSIQQELASQFAEWQEDYDNVRKLLRFSGPFDDYDVILGIHAGAGGNDAQDWAGMLLRMYSRYAEKNNWKYSVIEESPGEEAGIKSVTLQIEGSYAYGKLKSEHGVHRLVRLSPFNAESRETSFAKVEIMPKIDAPEDLVIDEKDLKIDVYRSGGHGGQSVNTTDSAVRITHLPTGIVVAIQNERSQLQNRETAMTILRSHLARLQLEQHKETLSELKGPSQSAEFGSQIRNYVLHPYKQVKDVRTGYESKDPNAILDGELDGFVNAYLEHTLTT
ncbi:MAG: prfB [Candidatus Saccharibacteria bacterium]|nr:prfB [Candidatus Saccharibacteria bacterium]